MREYYHQSGINASLSQTAEGRTAVFIIEALHDLFTAHFDSGWFLNILERMSFSSNTLREIRNMLQLKEIYVNDLPQIENGIESLEQFIVFVERYVQPVLRDELGVSGFRSRGPASGEGTENVVRGFFLYTFPHNMARLSELHSQLKPLLPHLRREAADASSYTPLSAAQ